MSFTLREIMGQYKALNKTIDRVRSDCGKIRRFFDETRPRRILFTGCGSSYSLSCSMRSIASSRLDIPVYALASGDLWLNCEAYAPMLEGALVVSLSRSGRTSELINAYNAVKAVSHDVKFLSILCAEGTPIETLSDMSICLPWAFDQSVCQTRCVSNLYAAGALLIGAISGDTGIERGLERVAALGEGYLENSTDRIQALARKGWDSAVVLGDGPSDGLAEEGALAFKEISQLPSNFYHLLDVRHGPIVLIGAKTLVLALVKSPACHHEQALIQDLVKKGAQVAVYSNLPLEVPGAESFSLGEEVGPIAGGLGLVALCQMISYYKAREVGCDPDLPDGLDPWIKIV